MKVRSTHKIAHFICEGLRKKDAFSRLKDNLLDFSYIGIKSASYICTRSYLDLHFLGEKTYQLLNITLHTERRDKQYRLRR